MGNKDNQVQRVRVRRVTGDSVSIGSDKEVENPVFYSDGIFKYVVIGPFSLGAHRRNSFEPHFNSANSGASLGRLGRLDYRA